MPVGGTADGAAGRVDGGVSAPASAKTSPGAGRPTDGQPSAGVPTGDRSLWPQPSARPSDGPVRVTPLGSVVSAAGVVVDGGTTGCDPVSDSQETGTGRFDRNQADAISSKIGVVSPRSNALAFGSWPGNCPSGSRDGTRGANSSSAGSGTRLGGGLLCAGLGGNPPIR